MCCADFYDKTTIHNFVSESAYFCASVYVFVDSVVKLNCEKRNTAVYWKRIRGRGHAHMCLPSWYFMRALFVSLTQMEEKQRIAFLVWLSLCAVIIFNQITLISFFSAGNLVHCFCSLGTVGCR